MKSDCDYKLVKARLDHLCNKHLSARFGFSPGLSNITVDVFTLGVRCSTCSRVADTFGPVRLNSAGLMHSTRVILGVPSLARSLLITLPFRQLNRHVTLQ